MALLDGYCSTSEHQAGFKKGYSCTGRLFLLRGLLEEQLFLKHNVYAVFIDFSSFFDTVRGEILCAKLCDRNIPEYLIRAIYGMLRDVKATVQMKGKLGRQFCCRVGLRQGSKSSPKLATLLLDEITNLLLSCKGGINLFETTINHIFYADDLVLLFERYEETNHALSKLKTLCESFGLNVSVEKSFSVYFTKKRDHTTKPFLWGNQVLPVEKSAKYLGCTLMHNLNFKHHVSLVEQKANSAFALVMNFQKRFPSLSFSSFVRLYNSLVLPVYTYSAEVFGWTEGDVINSIFTEHLRRYFGLPKRTGRNAILYLTGTLPIHTKVFKTGYTFWTNLAKMGESRFEKMIYRSMKQSVHPNWFREMCSVFRQIGFHGDFEYWNSKWIISQKNRFTSALESHFSSLVQTWVNESSYTLLHENLEAFGTPAHFLDTASFWDRRILSKFALKVYKFESVTGSWHSLVRKERFCQYCWKNYDRIALGDEVHYLEKCPRFTKNRGKTALNASELTSTLFNKRIGFQTTSSQYHTLAKFIHMSFDQLSDPFVT